jgi:selenide,water dikinase
MAAASGVTVRIDIASVPVLSGVRDLVGANRSTGLSSNRKHFGPQVSLAEGTPADLADLAYDPQTSGGLLVAVRPDQAEAALSALRSSGATATTIVGSALAPVGKHVILGQ